MLTAALKSVSPSLLQAFLPRRDRVAMAIIHSPHRLQITLSRRKEALRKYYIPVRNDGAPSRDLVPNSYQMWQPSEAPPHRCSPSWLPSSPEPLARQEHRVLSGLLWFPPHPLCRMDFRCWDWQGFPFLFSLFFFLLL